MYVQYCEIANEYLIDVKLANILRFGLVSFTPLELFGFFDPQQKFAAFRNAQEKEKSAEEQRSAHHTQLPTQRNHDEGRDQGDRVQHVDEGGQHLTVEMGAEEWSKRGEKDHDGHADGQVVPSLGFASGVGHKGSPVEAHAGVDGHQDDRSGRRHLLADSKQQREHRKWADVDSGSGDGAENSAQEANRGQHHGLPNSEGRNRVEGFPLMLSVEQEKCECEREPNADKAQFLDRRGQHHVDDLQAEDHAEHGSEAAVEDRVPFQLDLHPKDGECCRGHAAGLDHQREISGDGRGYLQGQRHDRERHGAASFGCHA